MQQFTKVDSYCLESVHRRVSQLDYYITAAYRKVNRGSGVAQHNRNILSCKLTSQGIWCAAGHVSFQNSSHQYTFPPTQCSHTSPTRWSKTQYEYNQNHHGLHYNWDFWDFATGLHHSLVVICVPVADESMQRWNRIM